MIDETLLADPGRCPACAAILRSPATECPACHLSLRGPTAGRLWDVSREVARLLGERTRLIAVLRAEATIPAYVATAPGPELPPPPRPAMAGRPVATPPRAEWTPQRVQNLLLALGVVLLGVAAVIFVAVSWGRLGVGGRAAVLTGVTALSFAAGTVAHRRGLTATAEALSLLTVGLALLDCGGARAANLFDLRDVDGLVFAAGSAALVASLAAAGAVTLPTRALRLSAAVLGQLPLPLLAVHLADTSRHPAALLAAATTAQALLGLAVAVWWPGRGDSRDARVVVGVGAVAAAVVATALALGAAYGEEGSLVVGSVLLLVLAAGAAAAAEVDGVRLVADRAPTFLRGAAAALVVASAWAAVDDAVGGRWLPLALAATAAALLAATALVPLDRRVAPVAVTLVATMLPSASSLGDLLPAAAGRVQWLTGAWSADSGSARRLLDLTGASGTVPTAWPSIAALCLLAAVVLAAPLLLRRLAPGRPLALPLVVAAGWLTPASLDASYPVALASDLVLATVLVLAATYALGRPDATRVATATAWAGLAAGSAVLAMAVVWSLAVDVATLVALPAAAVTLSGVAALSTRAARLRSVGTAAAVAAGLLLVAESGAVTRYAGAGWPAVWSVGLAALVVLATAGSAAVSLRSPATGYWTVTRRALAAVAAAGLVAEAAALSWWRDVAVAGQGLAVVAVGAALVAISTLPVPRRFLEPLDLRLVGGAGCALGLAASAVDADRLWVALLLTGVAAAVLGLREDARWGWPASILLTASSWVRLADAHVDTPEAYTVPPALLLLGFGLLRRHRDRQIGSWAAYSPALLLGLVPSLVRAVTDPGTTRPLLLGLAALAVLAVGVARRLQAPLVVGGVVLAVDAVVQLAPYLVAVYDAVPRWVTIGVVGLALVGAGATYERRVQDLRRVARSMSDMA